VRNAFFAVHETGSRSAQKTATKYSPKVSELNSTGAGNVSGRAGFPLSAAEGAAPHGRAFFRPFFFGRRRRCGKVLWAVLARAKSVGGRRTAGRREVSENATKTRRFVRRNDFWRA
jgi:hypothetical protein